MNDRYLRSMLRAATAAKILRGWQGPHTKDRSYTITPANAPARERSLVATIEYVRSLEAAGITPLHRESEGMLYANPYPD
jgi:hypothetical protein